MRDRRRGIYEVYSWLGWGWDWACSFLNEESMVHIHSKRRE
jgi:hypothetical protein